MQLGKFFYEVTVELRLGLSTQIINWPKIDDQLMAFYRNKSSHHESIQEYISK